MADDLDTRFNHHPPRDASIALAHQSVRENCLSLAREISSIMPDSREKSLALTKLEEVMFWANAGIARILNYQDGRNS